jgi:NAD-specific glutamate dehydrogenase
MRNLIAYMEYDKKTIIKQNLSTAKKMLSNAMKNINDNNCEQETLSDNIINAILWLKKTRDL